MRKVSQFQNPSLDDDVDPLFLVALIQLELSGGRIGAREHKRTRAHSGGGAEDDHLDGIFRSLLMAPHIILSLSGVPHCCCPPPASVPPQHSSFLLGFLFKRPSFLDNLTTAAPCTTKS